MKVNGRVSGPTMILGSGHYFDFDDPRANPITLEDLAYGLAFEARWSGQCVQRRTGKRVFYSVAQHCVVGAWHCEQTHFSKEMAFAFLMHEVAEFAMGDFCGPAKILCPDFKAIEARIEGALLRFWNVPAFDKATIKIVDQRMAVTERRDLTAWNHKDIWSYYGDISPYSQEIQPWSANKAARNFINAFNRLAPPAALHAMKGSKAWPS